MPMDAVSCWLRGNSLFVKTGQTVTRMPADQPEALLGLLRHRASLASRTGATKKKLDAMVFQHSIMDWRRKGGVIKPVAPGDAIAHTQPTDEERRQATRAYAMALMEEL